MRLIDFINKCINKTYIAFLSSVQLLRRFYTANVTHLKQRTKVFLFFKSYAETAKKNNNYGKTISLMWWFSCSHTSVRKQDVHWLSSQWQNPIHVFDSNQMLHLFYRKSQFSTFFLYCTDLDKTADLEDTLTS